MHKKGSAEFFACLEVFSEMKTSEWNDLTTPNVMSTKMPSFPLLSALTLHRSKIDTGTWIQIFSIFSNPWGISMLIGTERRTNIKGVFLWSRLFSFFSGLCRCDWEGSRPRHSFCMWCGEPQGVVNLCFSAKTLASCKVHCFQECPCLWSFPPCVLTDN